MLCLPRITAYGKFLYKNPPATDFSISVNSFAAPDIPEPYLQAYELVRLMEKDPLQFLFSKFRMTVPWEIHCKFADDFRNYLLKNSLEKLSRHFQDQQSLDTVSLGMKRLLSYPSADLFKSFLHDPVYMMTQQEWDEYNDFVQKTPAIIEKYHHAFQELSATEFYYEHGLIYLDDKIKSKIRDGIVLDCGSFDGASMVVMAEYHPEKIIGFEPSEKNIGQCRKNLQNAQVNCPYDIFCSCVGDRDGVISFEDSGNSMASISNSQNGSQVPICKIDTFCEKNNIDRVSWIKADLEGAALDMIKGAEKIIRRDRPLLTIGVYHSPQEFFEIPELLHQWIPEYKMMLRRCQCFPTCPYNELTLIVYTD